MLPAKALVEWQTAPSTAIADLSVLSAADQQEEAVAIAMVLRGALETPGAHAALVTPDRDLAGRVTTELLRYGVVADDSAGETLSDTPPAVFLRLLARAVADELAPVPLLALLKHPLAAAGVSPAACRAAARVLELACLRGPRPRPGLPGLRRAVDRARAEPEVVALLDRVETCLEPALRIAASIELAPAQGLAALIEAAERLAATDELPGPARLWAGEEGEALAARLAEVLAALLLLPDQRRDVLPGLLDAVLEGAVVRSRRALRGRYGTEHPRVFIWGLLEARLQTADVMVLGGLAEGVWPPLSDPGPWLSRPMRATVGLPSPEEVVGQAAHDFVACACAAPTVVLSCPRRLDGAPVVPARWLTRLETLLSGQGAALPRHPAAAWVRDPGPARGRAAAGASAASVSAGRAAATQAVGDRDRDLAARSVRDPCQARAASVGAETAGGGDRRRGLRHAGACRAAPFPRTARHTLAGRRRGPDAPRHDAGAGGGRSARGAGHLVGAAARRGSPTGSRASRRSAGARARRWRSPPRSPARIELTRPGGVFRLTGRADRIERRRDGGLAILDYKTGTPPSQKEVDAGLAPQLLLEAAMAAAGGVRCRVDRARRRS